LRSSNPDKTHISQGHSPLTDVLDNLRGISVLFSVCRCIL